MSVTYFLLAALLLVRLLVLPLLTPTTGYQDQTALPSVLLPQKSRPTVTETLWLVTCDTRDSPDLASWTLFATAVQHNFRKIQQQQQQEGDGKTMSQQRVRDVEVRNICHGKPWDSLMTKYRYMIQFLGNVETIGKDERKVMDDDIVIFTDSDVLYNVWGVGVSEVMERYDAARSGRPILIGAEPNCWVGGFCDAQIMLSLYPNEAPTRSSCPRFINSGMYMGPAKSLRTMLDQMSNEDVIVDMCRALGIKEENDQGRMIIWYRVFGQQQQQQEEQQQLAMIDTRAMLFRNTFFGFVDASKLGSYCWGKCGS
jgi:phage anti-repressor protein